MDRPHPDDLVHRTTIRIPYPLLDELDELHKEAMRQGELPRSASRNEFIVLLINEAAARRKAAASEATRPRPHARRR